MDRRDLAPHMRWWFRCDGRIAYSAWFTKGEDEDGEPLYDRIPVEMVVCTACDGVGQYTNPDIDRQGLSREDFDEDPDFAESYFHSDLYKIPCQLCKGLNVIPVPIEEETLKEIQEVLDGRRDDYNEAEAERRMGA